MTKSKKRKPIVTTSQSRFLNYEYKTEKIKEFTFEGFEKKFKGYINTCPHCGVKSWNEPRCKCDLI